MKTMKTMLALLLAAILMLTVAGCGSSNGEYQLVTAGTLTVGTNAQFPPFEFLNGTQPDGVDMALMKAVAAKLGLELKISDMEFDSLDSALSGGKIDIIAAGFTIRPDRMEKMDFTDTYYKAEQTIIVQSGSGITSKEGISGKKIGAQSGTTGFFAAEELTDSANIKGYTNGATAVADLLNGNLDAVIIDDNPAKAYKQQHGAAVTLITGQFDPEEYAFAVKKGNTALKDAVNKTLAEMKADGSFDEIIATYIQ
ncbi:MAG: basic amino acid ABC transporter substrate-binding protein [Acutalibacteraceae bacterium]|jgi:ABC-type amino acid transport substrate-binding protein